MAIAQWRQSSSSIIFSLFSFGGNWNQSKFESTTAQAYKGLGKYLEREADFNQAERLGVSRTN